MSAVKYSQLDFPFYTQFHFAPHVGEVTGSETQVSTVPVSENSVRIAQMQLSGLHLEASRTGYQYGPDDVLPDEIVTHPGRGTDIVILSEYIEGLGERIREHIATMSLPKEEPAAPPVGDVKAADVKPDVKPEA